MARYTPNPAPPVVNVTDLLSYVQSELNRISAWSEQPTFSVGPKIDIRTGPPANPQDGQIAYANGTDWNPGGSGAGIYAYIGGSWTKL